MTKKKPPLPEHPLDGAINRAMEILHAAGVETAMIAVIGKDEPVRFGVFGNRNDLLALSSRTNYVLNKKLDKAFR